MEEFENLTEAELRKLLIATIEETHGRDYLLGWLKFAYTNGHIYIDTDRDFLIAEIRNFRDRLNSILKV
jgi:hypothetical protein